MTTLTRLSGAGNTFFLLDGFTFPTSETQAQALTTKICREIPGKETDGFFVILPDPQVDFRWMFFNDDGSKPDMCGNAARCAALFFTLNTGFKNMNPTFRTEAGIIQSEVLSPAPDKTGNYKVAVDLPELRESGKQIKIGQESFFFINTGVPHLVVLENPDRDRGRSLRSARELGEEGANVTFLKGNRAVSFERGVENFTRACGTGAIAAAAYLKTKGSGTHFKIEMPGGALEVRWLSPMHPRLIGPVKIDFKIELDIERMLL